MINRFSKISFLVILLLAGCGDAGPQGDRVNISITVNPSTAGTVLTSGGDEIGNEVEFLAVPNQNWQFAGWSGDIESFENPLSFMLEDNVNLTANFSLFSNDYKFDMLLTDGDSEADLEFGQIPGATDSYDSGIDLEAPPPPPGETVYAWFENGDRDLLHDYRNAFASEITWDIEFQPGSTGNILFEWTSERESFTGSLVLTEPGGSFEVDMIEENSHTVQSEDIESLQIRYRFQE